MSKPSKTYCPACGHPTNIAPADSESTSHQCRECGTYWTLHSTPDSAKEQFRIDMTSCGVDESPTGRICEEPSLRRHAKIPAPHFHSRLPLLTAREREVMDLVVAGETNSSTAQLLNISVSAIEKHRASSMKKLRTKSLVDVVRMYVAADASLPTSADFCRDDFRKGE